MTTQQDYDDSFEDEDEERQRSFFNRRQMSSEAGQMRPDAFDLGSRSARRDQQAARSERVHDQGEGSQTALAERRHRRVPQGAWAYITFNEKKRKRRKKEV